MAIKEITGYKWQNENAAHSAEAIATQFYGYPTAPENVTQTAFEAKHNEGSEGDFWYFPGDLAPLGNVTTFTINED
jgi:hypothetical protein